MRVIAIIVGLSVVLGIVAVFMSRPMSSVIPVSVSQAQPPVIIEGTSSVPYQNTFYGFSLWRPQGSILKNDLDSGYAATRTPVISVSLPRALFAGTNLSEASLIVGVSSASDALASCVSAHAGEALAGTVPLAGETFSIFKAADAGAGNFYETISYRTIHRGTCFEVVELLHSTNVGNYPPGTVVPFDHARFAGYLEAMAKTFSFIAPTGSGVEGRVYAQLHCSDPNDPSCGLETVVSAYKNEQLITHATSSPSGYYRLPLDAGSYELRAGESGHRCTSIGVVVPPNQFISANVMCSNQ